MHMPLGALHHKHVTYVLFGTRLSQSPAHRGKHSRPPFPAESVFLKFVCDVAFHLFPSRPDNLSLDNQRVSYEADVWKMNASYL